MAQRSAPLQIDVALHPEELREALGAGELQQTAKKRRYKLQWDGGGGELTVQRPGSPHYRPPVYRAHIVSGRKGALLTGTVTESRANLLINILFVVAGAAILTALLALIVSAAGPAVAVVVSSALVTALPLIVKKESPSRRAVLENEARDIQRLLEELLPTKSEEEVRAGAARDEEYYATHPHTRAPQLICVLVEAKNGKRQTWTDDQGREWVAYLQGERVHLALAESPTAPLTSYTATGIEQMQAHRE